MDHHVAFGVNHQSRSVVIAPHVARGFLSAQQGLHAGHKNAGLHRLEDVVVGPGFKSCDLAVVFPAGGQKGHNRLSQGLVLTNLRARLDTVHLGHHDVEENQVGKEFFGQSHAFASVAGRVHVIPFFDEVVFDEFEDVWLVVHEQNALLAHGSKFITGMFIGGKGHVKAVLTRR